MKRILKFLFLITVKPITTLTTEIYKEITRFYIELSVFIFWVLQAWVVVNYAHKQGNTNGIEYLVAVFFIPLMEFSLCFLIFIILIIIQETIIFIRDKWKESA